MNPVRRSITVTHGDSTRRRDPIAGDIDGFSDALKKRRGPQPAGEEPRDTPSDSPFQGISPVPMALQRLAKTAARDETAADPLIGAQRADTAANVDAPMQPSHVGLPALVEADPHFRVVSGPWAGLEISASYRGSQVVVLLRPKTATQEKMLGKSRQMILEQIHADTGQWVRIDMEEATNAPR